jgi:hypothetical protein
MAKENKALAALIKAAQAVANKAAAKEELRLARIEAEAAVERQRKAQEAQIARIKAKKDAGKKNP